MTALPALPAYTGADSRCAKCGARDATTTYRAENRRPGLLNEHLERGCTRCGYQWAEATIDTITSAEGNAATPASVRTSKEVTQSDRATPVRDGRPS